MNLFLMNFFFDEPFPDEFFFRLTFNLLFEPLIYCSALFCLVE